MSWISSVVSITIFDREKIAAILEINKLDLANFLKISCYFLDLKVKNPGMSSLVSLVSLVSSFN